MCGNENGFGIITALIAAAGILVFAFAEKHGDLHAAPAQHTISAPASHVAFELSPVALDIDIAHARVSVEVNL